MFLIIFFIKSKFNGGGVTLKPNMQTKWFRTGISMQLQYTIECVTNAILRHFNTNQYQ